MTLFFFAVKGEATLKKGLKKLCKISKNPVENHGRIIHIARARPNAML